MEDELRIINYAKRELESYFYVMKLASLAFIEKSNLQDQELDDPNVDNRIKELRRELDNYTVRLQNVEAFLNKLTLEDQTIIKELYLVRHGEDRKTYENLGFDVGMSTSTLYRHVKDLILNNW